MSMSYRETKMWIRRVHEKQNKEIHRKKVRWRELALQKRMDTLKQENKRGIEENKKTQTGMRIFLIFQEK